MNLIFDHFFIIFNEIDLHTNKQIFCIAGCAESEYWATNYFNNWCHNSKPNTCRLSIYIKCININLFAAKTIIEYKTLNHVHCCAFNDISIVKINHVDDNIIRLCFKLSPEQNWSKIVVLLAYLLFNCMLTYQFKY